MREESFDPTNGFWDDGAWISWNFINKIREDYEIRKAFSEFAVPQIFEQGAYFAFANGATCNDRFLLSLEPVRIDRVVETGIAGVRNRQPD